jgi:hypothetical protein
MTFFGGMGVHVPVNSPDFQALNVCLDADKPRSFPLTQPKLAQFTTCLTSSLTLLFPLFSYHFVFLIYPMHATFPLLIFSPKFNHSDDCRRITTYECIIKLKTAC